MNLPEPGFLPFDVASPTNVSLTLWLEDPAVERKRPGVTIAIGFPMSNQSFVAAAPMSYTSVEVFTLFGDLAGKGAIPCPALIFDVEGAPQVTRQAKPGRRRGPEITVTDDCPSIALVAKLAIIPQRLLSSKSAPNLPGPISN